MLPALRLHAWNSIRDFMHGKKWVAPPHIRRAGKKKSCLNALGIHVSCVMGAWGAPRILLGIGKVRVYDTVARIDPIATDRYTSQHERPLYTCINNSSLHVTFYTEYTRDTLERLSEIRTNLDESVLNVSIFTNNRVRVSELIMEKIGNALNTKRDRVYAIM